MAEKNVKLYTSSGFSFILICEILFNFSVLLFSAITALTSRVYTPLIGKMAVKTSVPFSVLVSVMDIPVPSMTGNSVEKKGSEGGRINFILISDGTCTEFFKVSMRMVTGVVSGIILFSSGLTNIRISLPDVSEASGIQGMAGRNRMKTAL